MDTKALSKDQLRAAQKYLREENRKWPDNLIPVPKEQWPKAVMAFHAVVVQVLRSRHFLVQIWNEKSRTRLSVCRSELTGSGDYKDGISWEEMMQIKRECGYGDRDAVEVYPRDVDIVNVANMRHLWIIRADELDCIWRKKQ